jgi:hypothetical protein
VGCDGGGTRREPNGQGDSRWAAPPSVGRPQPRTMVRARRTA